jgi:UDP-glucose 4-epimerase
LRDYVHIIDLAQVHIFALQILQIGASTTACKQGNDKEFSVQ